MECLKSDGASSWHFNAFQHSSYWQASNSYQTLLDIWLLLENSKRLKRYAESPLAPEIMLTLLQVLEHVRGNTGPEVEREFLEVDYPSLSFLKRDADLGNLDLCRC
jgi:hypothetical protein